LRVEDHSRSSMLTSLRSSLPVLFTISSICVPNCKQVYGRQANSDKITYFRGCPFSRHSRAWPPHPVAWNFVAEY